MLRSILEMEQKEGKPGRCRGSDCIHSVRVILGAKETQWTTIFKRNYQKKKKLKKREITLFGLY